jgi:maltose O-acetyltransferase
MVRGELYLASDPELVAARVRARRQWAEFNKSDPADPSLRALVCPGVTIGEEAVVGAGSVVVRDAPAGVVAAGNPCRVIKPICRLLWG